MSIIINVLERNKRKRGKGINRNRPNLENWIAENLVRQASAQG